MVVPTDRLARLRHDWQDARSALIQWAFSSDLSDIAAAERGQNYARRVVTTHEHLSDALNFRRAATTMARTADA